MPDAPISFPFRGLDDNRAHGEQSAGTTSDARNVRSRDPVTGRIRGAQRSGLSKQYTNQVSGGAQAVKDLSLLVYDNKQLDYADQAAATEWTTTTPNQGGVRQIEVDASGDVYVLEGSAKNAFHVYSAAGVRLASQPIAVDSSGGSNGCYTMSVDEQGDVWIGVSESAVAGDPTILRYTRTGETEWTLVYSISVSISSDAGHVRGLKVANSRLYALISNGQENASEISRVYIWDDIYSGTKPAAETVQIAIGTNDRGYSMDVSKNGDIFVTYIENTTGGTPKDQWLEKFDPAGNSVWTWQASVDGGGVGLSVVVSGIVVWTMGFTDGSDNVALRRLRDNGSTVTSQATLVDATAVLVRYHRLVIDAFGNVHVPFAQTIGGGTEYRIYDATAGTAALELGYTAFTVPVQAVGIPPTNPDYSGSATEPARPEFSYISGDLGPLRKLRLVSVASTAGSVRTHQPIGVANGDIWLLADVSVAAGNIVPPLPTTSDTAVIDTTSGWIMSAVMNGKWFMTDGVNYNTYDPVLDVAEPYTATSNGEIPPRCKLMVHWNERMVLGRNADDAHNIFFSAKGDAFNWDFAPYTPLTTQAFAANNGSTLGPIPDIVNTLIPYSDEMLIVGCDHEIWMLNGDPGAGGYLNLLSDVTGMAFGRSWAKDPNGNLYFFGSQGGVYRMNPYGEAPVRLSNGEGGAQTNIEERLRSVNLTTNHVQLIWNWVDDALHVLVEPFGAGSATEKAYIWEARTGAWWEDTYYSGAATPNTTRQPHSAMNLDGDDPDDRVLLYGCQDGYVRKWDKTATDDDSLQIDSNVLVGPILPTSAATVEGKFRALKAFLADDQSGCRVEVFVNDRADTLPTSPQRAYDLVPGQNPTLRFRERGASAWLRLRDASANRWALESLTLTMESGGRKRVRT